MKNLQIRRYCVLALSVLCVFSSGVASGSDMPRAVNPLAGTWTLVGADAIKPDGQRIRDYGEAPRGLLFVDSEGRYSLQIFKSERPRFATDNKADATQAEYRSAVMGSSTHFGSLAVDSISHTLTFSITAASFPNWEGTKQARHFELQDDVLSYQVSARPDGNVPISVWKRVKKMD